MERLHRQPELLRAPLKQADSARRLMEAVQTTTTLEYNQLHTNLLRLSKVITVADHRIYKFTDNLVDKEGENFHFHTEFPKIFTARQRTYLSLIPTVQ